MGPWFADAKLVVGRGCAWSLLSFLLWDGFS